MAYVESRMNTWFRLIIAGFAGGLGLTSALLSLAAQAQVIPKDALRDPARVGASLSTSSTGNSAADWLERIAKSARELPYTGIFVHTTPEGTTTSRITHVVDAKGVENEKIESLEGPMMEIVRRDEEMICYKPDEKTIRIDRRATGRFFPSLITGNPRDVGENYRVKLGAIERVAGFDCQWITLEPKDTMRYMQTLCADVATGLLLRARLYNDRNQVIEQFMFTQLDVSRRVARQTLRSRFERAVGWKRDEAVQIAGKDRDVDTGWNVGTLPAGFRKVMELLRPLAGRREPVAHLVFSDGVSHVSLFAEQSGEVGRVSLAGGSEDRPTTFATRTVADYQITVMGEVPLGAVQLIADSVTRRSK